MDLMEKLKEIHKVIPFLFASINIIYIYNNTYTFFPKLYMRFHLNKLRNSAIQVNLLSLKKKKNIGAGRRETMHAMLLLQRGDHPWPKHDPPHPRATNGPLVAIRGIFQVSVACRKLIGNTC